MNQLKQLKQLNPHWWQGEWIDNEDLFQNKLTTLNKSVYEGLNSDFDIETFYHCCDRFSKDLLQNHLMREKLLNILVSSGESSETEALGVLSGISDFLKESELRIKMSREVGRDDPFLSTRVPQESDVFESYSPLGFLVQILPSNDSALPVLSAFEGLLTGNVNLLKLSQHSSQFTSTLFDFFFANELAVIFKKRLIILKISSQEKERMQKIFREADGVVAWGGEEAIAEIKSLCSSKVRFIEWGHRISFSYISSQSKLNPSFIPDLVKDILIYSQQACSSPQCVYVENASFVELQEIGLKINEEMGQVAGNYRLLIPSAMESAEIQKTSLVVETEQALKSEWAKVIRDEKDRWRVLVDMRPALRASPLFRTVWLKPISRSQLWEVFRPLRSYLQTVGLKCELSELKELSQGLYQAGVNRIRPLGDMHGSYMGEPHDGYAALLRYMKKTSLKSDLVQLKTYGTLSDLERNEIKFSYLPERLMTKMDFQQQKIPSRTELFFKSGGSSGEPKISYFTYHDYHRQMDLAAKGLLAAGLDPLKDKCINLFFGGGLYGGFLSFYTILEKLQAVQFPMSAHMDFKFVGEVIVKNKINVLLGMPSYLMLLFEANKELFKTNQVIEKIYFGGEHLSELQKKHWQEVFGVKTFLSASYGSVDMGPLGYQCASSGPRIHHLHQSLHFLEIYKLDKEEPVEKGEVGRLVFSTLGREGQTLLRYDIGDVGKWIDEECPCGRKSPRFELLGRSGDIFRASSCFYSFSKFQQILADHLNYDQEFQILIDNQCGLDRLTCKINKKSQIEQDQVLSMLIKNYKDLQETVQEEKTMLLDFSFVDSADFLKSSASGKLLHVIDQRVR
jgi:phenylacetate-coenzyme A ligase PaaK-like adenylate-forming protein